MQHNMIGEPDESVFPMTSVTKDLSRDSSQGTCQKGTCRVGLCDISLPIKM